MALDGSLNVEFLEIVFDLKIFLVCEHLLGDDQLATMLAGVGDGTR